MSLVVEVPSLIIGSSLLQIKFFDFFDPLEIDIRVQKAISRFNSDTSAFREESCRVYWRLEIEEGVWMRRF